MLIGLLTLFILPDADRQANYVLSAIFQLQTFKESHFNRWRYISCYNGNTSKKAEVLDQLISGVRVFAGTFRKKPQTWKTRYKWDFELTTEQPGKVIKSLSSPKHKIWRWLFLKKKFIQFNKKITFKLPQKSLQSRSISIKILSFSEKKWNHLLEEELHFLK